MLLALRKGLEVAPRTLRARLGANLLLREAPQARRESLPEPPLPRLEVQRDVPGVEFSSGPGRTGWAVPSRALGGAGRGRQSTPSSRAAERWGGQDWVTMWGWPTSARSGPSSSGRRGVRRGCYLGVGVSVSALQYGHFLFTASLGPSISALHFLLLGRREVVRACARSLSPSEFAPRQKPRVWNPGRRWESGESRPCV